MDDYTQKSKNIVRHRVLSQAITELSINRQQACCVPRNYIRLAMDYFLTEDHAEKSYQEVTKVDSRYIKEWESLHDSIVGFRRPSDLSVCYLSGPQPENDFAELLSLGVLPQNIWAFENNRTIYLEAVEKYNGKSFPQPKIFKMSVEHFFGNSPQKFDVVYIDACGTIASDKHALRCVSTLFKYQRMNSPGVLITNFAKPNVINKEIPRKYILMIALYLLFKKTPNSKLEMKKTGELEIVGFKDMYHQVKEEFNEKYGEFISSLLSDIAALIIPLQRLGKMAKYSNLFSANEIKQCSGEFDLSQINQIKHNSICKWLLTLEWIKKHPKQSSKFSSMKASLFSELVGIEEDGKDLIIGAKLYVGLKNGTFGEKKDIESMHKFFDSNSEIYQFLDPVNSSLFFDVIINQLAYPMYSNIEESRSYLYCAKETYMYTDVLVVDECRYIYNWLPAISQIINAMKDRGWQYVFRFAIDALVKQRLNYNNEFFFQGSVISKGEPGFSAKNRHEREKIGDEI